MVRSWERGERCQRTTPAGDRTATKGSAALKIATDLRAALVDGAELRRGIEGHTRPVAVLVHTAHAGMLDDELLGHVVHQRRELDKEVAAFAATGAGGKVVEGVEHR